MGPMCRHLKMGVTSGWHKEPCAHLWWPGCPRGHVGTLGILWYSGADKRPPGECCLWWTSSVRWNSGDQWFSQNRLRWSLPAGRHSQVFFQIICPRHPAESVARSHKKPGCKGNGKPCCRSCAVNGEVSPVNECLNICQNIDEKRLSFQSQWRSFL